MAGKICDDCIKVIKPIVEEFGYFLVDVDYFKSYDGMNLEVTIDKQGGVDINDCEKVHRAIDGPLDELNPTKDEPYILSVSSPGLDRPVKNQYDFVRNKGKDVEIKLYKKLDGKKSYIGKLLAFDDEKVTIEMNGQEKTFIKDIVANISPVIEF